MHASVRPRVSGGSLLCPLSVLEDPQPQRLKLTGCQEIPLWPEQHSPGHASGRQAAGSGQRPAPPARQLHTRDLEGVSRDPGSSAPSRLSHQPCLGRHGEEQYVKKTWEWLASRQQLLPGESGVLTSGCSVSISHPQWHMCFIESCVTFHLKTSRLALDSSTHWAAPNLAPPFPQPPGQRQCCARVPHGCLCVAGARPATDLGLPVSRVHMDWVTETDPGGPRWGQGAAGTSEKEGWGVATPAAQPAELCSDWSPSGLDPIGATQHCPQNTRRHSYGVRVQQTCSGPLPHTLS